MIKLVRQLIVELNATTETGFENARTVELCSYALMVLIAKSDASFDESERITMKRLAQEIYQLPDELATKVLAEAEQEADNSTSLHEFTRVIHEQLSEPEKFQLVEGLWRIAYADGHIDKYEEHIIRRIAELIYLEHSRFIQAKHSAKDHTL